MDLSALFPDERPVIIQISKGLGKDDYDDGCSCFEKYTHLEVGKEIKVFIWRGSCCCCLGCCGSCIGFSLVSKLPERVRKFYFYKELTISQEEIANFGYIWATQVGKYWPVMALKNQDLIIVGPAEYETDILNTVNDIRVRFGFPISHLAEIPMRYRDRIL